MDGSNYHFVFSIISLCQYKVLSENHLKERNIIIDLMCDEGDAVPTLQLYVVNESGLRLVL